MTDHERCKHRHLMISLEPSGRGLDIAVMSACNLDDYEVAVLLEEMRDQVLAKLRADHARLN